MSISYRAEVGWGLDHWMVLPRRINQVPSLREGVVQGLESPWYLIFRGLRGFSGSESPVLRSGTLILEISALQKICGYKALASGAFRRSRSLFQSLGHAYLQLFQYVGPTLMDRRAGWACILMHFSNSFFYDYCTEITDRINFYMMHENALV